MNRLNFGQEEYTKESIFSGSLATHETLTGSELQYDELTIGIIDDGTTDFLTSDDKIFHVADGALKLKSMVTTAKYGEKATYYHNDKIVGNYYFKQRVRNSNKQYTVTLISGVGILNDSKHYGGIYFGILAKSLLKEIIGDIIPWSINPLLENQPLYGWLPVATRRDNLKQVLFAMSAAIEKDEKGDMYITFVSNDTAEEIPMSRIYKDGGSVSYPDAITSVSLSEHAYIARDTDETVTLFDGLISSDYITTPKGKLAQGGIVLFDEPAHNLTVEGSTILEATVNYAVLAPSADCVLTGQKYTHTVREVTRPETLDAAQMKSAAMVSNATLVSVANSENIAERLISFYSSAKTVSMDIVLDGEKPGQNITFTDPFFEYTQGIITNMTLNMSAITKAKIDVIAGYSPENQGNYYKNSVVLRGTDTFDIPEDTEKMRIVLIGGGQAGFKGETGQAGEASTGTSYKKGGAGGKGGKGGKGGNILIFTLDATDLTSLSVDCGTGGADGNGETGTDSTLSTYKGTSLVKSYSSEAGTTSSIGYIEIFSGIAYGLEGGEGIAGADGTDPNNPETTLVYDGVTYTSGTKGADGSFSWSKNGQKGTVTYKGGYGGGAAVAVNGNDSVSTEGTRSANCTGGAGANATVNGANATVYGAGGSGGNGGGGGGAGGYAAERWKDDDGSYSWNDVMAGGAGGTGSLGGAGSDGCVILYY